MDSYWNIRFIGSFGLVWGGNITPAMLKGSHRFLFYGLTLGNFGFGIIRQRLL